MAAEISIKINARNFEQAAAKIEGSSTQIANALRPILTQIQAVQNAFSNLSAEPARQSVLTFQRSAVRNLRTVRAHIAETQVAFAGLAATIKAIPLAELQAIATAAKTAATSAALTSRAAGTTRRGGGAAPLAMSAVDAEAAFPGAAIGAGLQQQAKLTKEATKATRDFGHEMHTVYGRTAKMAKTELEALSNQLRISIQRQEANAAAIAAYAASSRKVVNNQLSNAIKSNVAAWRAEVNQLKSTNAAALKNIEVRRAEARILTELRVGLLNASEASRQYLSVANGFIQAETKKQQAAERAKNAIRANTIALREQLTIAKASLGPIAQDATLKNLQARLFREVAEEGKNAAQAMREYGAAAAPLAQAANNRAAALALEKAQLAAVAAVNKQNKLILQDALLFEKERIGSVRNRAAVLVTERQILQRVAEGHLSVADALVRYNAAASAAGTASNRFTQAHDTLRKAVTLAVGPLNRMGSRLNAITDLYLGISPKTAAVVVATVGLTVAIVKAVGAAKEFEAAMVAVAKTTGASDTEIEKLSGTLLKMSSDLGLPAKELAEIAAAAGQLGIRGNAALAAFAEEIGKITRTSDLAAGTAAKAFARIITITGEAPENVKQLGSAIIALGNNFAASESEITQTALEIGKIGSVVGLTSTDVAALGAAFAQLGVSVQNAGTSSGRVLLSIREHARAGGEGLAELVNITGLAQHEIQKFANTDITKVFLPFLAGLQRIEAEGSDATAVLRQFGLSGVREAKALLPLITRVKEVQEAFKTAKEAAASGSATNDEFAKRAQALAAQQEKLGVRLHNIGVTIGNELIPTVTAFIKGINFLISDTNAWGSAIAVAVKALLAMAAAIAAIKFSALILSTQIATAAMFKAAGVIGLLVTAYQLLGDAAIRAATGIDEANEKLDKDTARGEGVRKAIDEFRNLEKLLANSSRVQGDSQIQTMIADLHEFIPLAAHSEEAFEAIIFVLDNLKNRAAKLGGEKFKLPINEEEIADAAEEIEKLVDSLGDLITQRNALAGGDSKLELINAKARGEALKVVKDLNEAEQELLLKRLHVKSSTEDVTRAIYEITRARRDEYNATTPLEDLLTEIIVAGERETVTLQQLESAMAKVEEVNFDGVVAGLSDVDRAVAEARNEIVEMSANFGELGIGVEHHLKKVEEAVRNTFKIEFFDQFQERLRELRFDSAKAGMTEVSKSIAEGTIEVIKLAKEAGITGKQLVGVAQQAAAAFRENFQAKTFDGIVQGLRNVLNQARELATIGAGGPDEDRNQALVALKEQFKQGEIGADQFNAALKATNSAFDVQKQAQLLNILSRLETGYDKVADRVKSFGREFHDAEGNVTDLGLTFEQEAAAKADLVRNALNEMIALGISPSNKAFQLLKDQANNTNPSIDSLGKIVKELRGNLEANADKALKPFDPLIKSAEEALAEDGPIKTLKSTLDQLRADAASMVMNFNIDPALKAIATVKQAMQGIGTSGGGGGGSGVGGSGVPLLGPVGETQNARRRSSSLDGVANGAFNAATGGAGMNAQQLLNQFNAKNSFKLRPGTTSDLPTFQPDASRGSTPLSQMRQQVGGTTFNASSAANRLADHYTAPFDDAMMMIRGTMNKPVQGEVNMDVTASGSPTLPFSEYFGRQGYVDSLLNRFSVARNHIGFHTNITDVLRAIEFRNRRLAEAAEFPTGPMGPLDPLTGFKQPPSSEFINPPSGGSGSSGSSGKASVADRSPWDKEIVNRLTEVSTKLDRVASFSEITADNTRDAADAAADTAAGIRGETFVSKTTKRQNRLIRARSGKRTSALDTGRL